MAKLTNEKLMDLRVKMWFLDEVVWVGLSKRRNLGNAAAVEDEEEDRIDGWFWFLIMGVGSWLGPLFGW